MFYFSGLPSTYHKTEKEALLARENATADGKIKTIKFSEIKIKPTKNSVLIPSTVFHFLSRVEIIDFISSQKDSLFFLISLLEENKELKKQHLQKTIDFSKKYASTILNEKEVIDNYTKEISSINRDIERLIKLVDIYLEINENEDEETLILFLYNKNVIYLERL